MAEVQYVDKGGNRKTTRMGAPKRADSIDHWFRAARKAIPSIPKIGDDGWVLAGSVATTDFIRFDLLNAIQEKCYVVIDRSKPSM